MCRGHPGARQHADPQRLEKPGRHGGCLLIGSATPPVQEVIRLTQQHRGLSAGWLAGNDKMAEARLAKMAEVEQAATGVGQ